MKKEMKITTPRKFVGNIDDFGTLEIGLQRTCKLVEEWSAKYNAKTEPRYDSNVDPNAKHFYRVADYSEAAADEAQTIYQFVFKTLRGKEAGVFPLAVEPIEKLLAAGYSQLAIDEVLNA